MILENKFLKSNIVSKANCNKGIWFILIENIV